MNERTQHLVGGLVVLTVVAVIGWHLYAARTTTPTSGEYMPYYGPPTGLAQTLAQENPDVTPVLPSTPSAITARDEWRARARSYDATAPVLGMM